MCVIFGSADAETARAREQLAVAEAEKTTAQDELRAQVERASTYVACSPVDLSLLYTLDIYSILAIYVECTWFLCSADAETARVKQQLAASEEAVARMAAQPQLTTDDAIAIAERLSKKEADYIKLTQLIHQCVSRHMPHPVVLLESGSGICFTEIDCLSIRAELFAMWPQSCGQDGRGRGGEGGGRRVQQAVRPTYVHVESVMKCIRVRHELASESRVVSETGADFSVVHLQAQGRGC